MFESLVTYCHDQLSSIPLTFVLGFYVSLIVSRYLFSYVYWLRQELKESQCLSVTSTQSSFKNSIWYGSSSSSPTTLSALPQHYLKFILPQTERG